MPRSKPSAKDIKERKDRSRVWKEFRRDYLFTQNRLAEMLGISRRTVQDVEAAKITPHADTLRTFLIFKKKHEREAGRDYS